MIAKFGFKRTKSRPEIDMAAPPNGQFRAQSSAHVESSSASATNPISPRPSKLVKSPDRGKHVMSVSNTMKMALASASSSTPVLTTSTRPEILHSNSTPNPSMRHAPRSQAEQYWAARALTAETLLVARKEHYEDVRSVTFVAETRRGNEVAKLSQIYDMRLGRLERLLAVILGFFLIISFFILISHLSLVHSSHSSGRQSQWAHFTIPILSPFASVVEHEVSVIGSKTITAISLIIACLGYFVFRYWISRSPEP